MKSIYILFLFFAFSLRINAQVTLEADGPGETYELINSVLAPGGDAVESPDCAHPEFGRHIAEVWDAELNQYVFEFYIHVTPDNDRCINFDRQRIEIKTYAPSPENLKGVVDERIEYRWKFRLPEGFQPSSSFTHIHQIKAVGGDDGNPLFTLTPRKGSPNRLELIHNNTTKVATIPLALFEGNWVECREILSVGANGTYSLEIRQISDGNVLLSYHNDNLMTIRPDNDFIRPKWGIYRSLNNAADLRDEAVRFAGFSIEELSTGVAESSPLAPAEMCLQQNYPNPFNPSTTIEYELPRAVDIRLTIYDMLGRQVKQLVNDQKPVGRYSIIWDATEERGTPIAAGLYFCRMETAGFVQTRKMLLVR